MRFFVVIDVNRPRSYVEGPGLQRVLGAVFYEHPLPVAGVPVRSAIESTTCRGSFRPKGANFPYVDMAFFRGSG